MELIVKWKFALQGLINQILSSPSTTFLVTAGIFVSSIVIFFLLYWFLHHFHQVSLVRYKNQNLIGFNIPLPAFQASDALRSRIEVRVKNELRLREFIGDSTNISWQSFSQDDLISRQFPQEGNRWRDFREMSVLGTTPQEMVETIFKKYGALKYRIVQYRDNYFDTIFPIKVMGEYFRVQSIEDLQRRIQAGALNPSEQALFAALSTIAPTIRNGIFQQGAEGQLFALSDFLIGRANEVSRGLDEPDRLKNIIYGEVLSTLAPSQTNMQFVFESIPIAPEPMDFLYLSTTIATSNLPGEIIPITNDVRAAIWIQLMLSYFILALNVAALLKWLKI